MISELHFFFFVMIRRPPRSTRTDTLFPYTTLFRSLQQEIATADTKQRLEDLYAPYKPKRRTRAQIAREAGLEPLADAILADPACDPAAVRSEEHTSELQSLMRISYAVFCLKKQTKNNKIHRKTTANRIIRKPQ